MWICTWTLRSYCYYYSLCTHFDGGLWLIHSPITNSKEHSSFCKRVFNWFGRCVSLHCCLVFSCYFQSILFRGRIWSIVFISAHFCSDVDIIVILLPSASFKNSSPSLNSSYSSKQSKHLFIRSHIMPPWIVLLKTYLKELKQHKILIIWTGPMTTLSILVDDLTDVYPGTEKLIHDHACIRII